MLKNRITNILRKEIVKDKYDKFIFLCIGTKEITGDAIGPTVGDILTDKLKKDNIIILGNKYKELNYININNELKQELKKYKLPYIITIDSALSENEYEGSIIINREYLGIGTALNKSKIIIGNLNIKAITGKNYNDLEKNIKSIKIYSKKLINDMANNIAMQIINSFCN